MENFLEEYNINLIRHKYCASHVSALSISTSPSLKKSRIISSEQISLFQEITKKLDVEVGTLIFNNGLTFRTCKSRDMADIILKSKKVLREYTVPSRGEISGTILDV